MFMEATTYAESHRHWQSAPEWENEDEGILGVSPEGLLYRSSQVFTSWAVQAVLSTEDLQEMKVDTFVRTASARYYAVVKGKLYSLDPISGVLRHQCDMSLDKHPVRRIAGFCASSWLHQKHSEQLFCVVKQGEDD